MRDEGEQVHANSSAESASKKSSAKLESGPSDVEYTQWPKFTSAQVSKHARLNDGWIIVHERVYDITSFAKTHPGFNNAGQVSTALAIGRSLGKDATEEFTEIHSLTAWKQLRDFQIGVLAREGEDASVIVSEDDNIEHVIPEWLKNDRDFWVRYSGGVDASVLRYLTKNGYPQEDDGDDVKSESGRNDDDPEKNKNKNTKNTNTRKSATTKINIKILAFVVAFGSSALAAAVKSNNGAKTSEREEHHRWVWEGNNNKLTSRAR
jgi:cytochrome b involved in lipid metabolism